MMHSRAVVARVAVTFNNVQTKLKNCRCHSAVDDRLSLDSTSSDRQVSQIIIEEVPACHTKRQAGMQAGRRRRKKSKVRINQDQDYRARDGLALFGY